MCFVINMYSIFSVKVDAFPITVMFGMCSIFLLVAAVLQRRLMVISEKPSKYNSIISKPLEFGFALFSNYVDAEVHKSILVHP